MLFERYLNYRLEHFKLDIKKLSRNRYVIINSNLPGGKIEGTSPEEVETVLIARIRKELEVGPIEKIDLFFERWFRSN